MDIVTALTALTNLQAGLSITSPVRSTVKTALAFAPPRASALPDTPCWINDFDLTQVETTLGTSDPPIQHYTIHSQLFVKEANLQQGAKIAAAYMVALMAAWNKNPFLGGAVSLSVPRGGNPTLAMLEWAGQAYPGLNLFFDIDLLA